VAIDTQRLLQNLVGAVNAASGVNPVIRYILDNLLFPGLINEWLFPKPEVDLFKLFEKRIERMIEKQVEVAVAEAAFARVRADLVGLSNAFSDFANAVDVEDRRLRRAVLITHADITAAGIEAVSDRYLYLLADALLLVASAHLGVLLEEVKAHPERYENQIAVNETAIRYSDLAGKLRDRFLAYRMSMIAEAKGIIEEQEVGTRTTPGNGAQKRIEFKAWDDFFDWMHNPNGYRNNILTGMETGWVQALGVDQTYHNKKLEAQAAVARYGEEAQKKVYAWWDAHLTGKTAEFTKLVDWDGRNSKRKPRDRLRVQAYPRQRIAAVNDAATPLQRLDLFIGQQMDQFVSNGPRYVQTYRILDPKNQTGDTAIGLFHRADSYDTAVAAIYLTARGDLPRACDLADGLCIALEHDPIGGGRIVAATNATALIDPAERYATSILYPDGATRDVGNACWAGLALTRLYEKTGQYRYLHNALQIGAWLIDACAVNDDWRGFSGGEDAWGTKRKWRSVEHNVDAYALFNNLFALTGATEWLAGAQRAKTLVLACLTPDGYYVTGTGESAVLNSQVIPTDVQTWTALAGINPAGNAKSLQYMLDHLGADSAGYPGFRFAVAGKDVQNEVTAGAAMALALEGGIFRAHAERYYTSLIAQQRSAGGGDGLGLVATPAAEADTGRGLGWKYFNYPHVAASAWMGLALLARDDPKANPYATVDAT
jgi:hypothetical protein